MRSLGATLALALWAFIQPQPAFRSGVQLLEVDARVFDEEGHFVTDLRPDDFEILEDGKPQSIQTMILVRGQDAQRGVTGGTGSGLAPHERARVPQTWIFVFDRLHLMPNGYRRAKTAVDSFMAERFRAGDLAGIVADEKMVDNRITSTRSEFLAALRKVRVPGDQAGRAADVAEAHLTGGDGQAGETIREILRGRNASEVERAARASTELLDGLAQGLARMRGPKTVVLMSDGWGLGKLENTLRTTVGNLNRAGARVYAIDTRGLEGPPSDVTNSLAIDTGGLALFNINNIGPALDRIATDTNTYYVLGYQPANANYDGRYRRIEVQVRRPGLTVRARRGYLALQPSQMLVPK